MTLGDLSWAGLLLQSQEATLISSSMANINSAAYYTHII